jgi:hypothetical protein
MKSYQGPGGFVIMLQKIFYFFIGPDIFKPEKIGKTLADVLIREAAKVLDFIKAN